MKRSQERDSSSIVSFQYSTQFRSSRTSLLFVCLLILLSSTIPITVAFGVARRSFHRSSSSTPRSHLRTLAPRSFSATTVIRMASASTDDTTPPQNNPLPALGLPSPVLLGSASFTRKLILKEMGIPFAKVVRPIDEKALGDRSQDPPDQLVLTLAKAKMDHLVLEIKEGRCHDDLPSPLESQEWIVLTGDQVVTCDDKILEKPESIEEARTFVANYRTHPPSTVGSCVLTHLPSGIQVSGVDTATIYFQSTIPEDLVDQLVALDEPILSCAGGLMIEHPLTKEHLDRIDGTEDSVMGLSKDLVLRLLQELKEKLDASRKE